MSKFYAIISGVGSGTGASAAQLFAKTYPVVLLARNPANYEPVVSSINAAGGKAIGIPTDASDPDAVDKAFRRIEDELPGAKLAAAVYNANGGFSIKPFLEMKKSDLDASLGTAANGLFYFAQKTIPQLLATVDAKPLHPPTLIVTGATASLKGSARFSTFAAGKFAQRALTQSLAREFGPQGVHVALAIIDGGIDTPWGKGMVMNNGVEDGKINPDAIAENYWYLHTQPRSAFTHELDLRPFVEKF
ncbi:hypothetical protein K4F52_004716 [Lecanicillium sp. MT-2017a]|nr:hypothetical protein K4F52_004716 [Lecanicillium sp. MT-2017a]